MMISDIDNEVVSVSTPSSLLNLLDGKEYIASLKKLVISSPDLNAEKIEHLKQKIANGSYLISDEAIAEGLISG